MRSLFKEKSPKINDLGLEIIGGDVLCQYTMPINQIQAMDICNMGIEMIRRMNPLVFIKDDKIILELRKRM